MPFTVLDPSTAQAAPATTVGDPLTSVGMTLLDFQTEVTADLQGRADFSTARLNRWINWGYLSISQMLDIKELWGSVGITTAADQPFYDLPDRLSWVKRVMIDQNDQFVAGGEEMAEIDEQTYRTLPDSDELQFSPLLPRSWFRFARMLVLWPTPDDAYDLAVDFRVRPQNLVDATDSPILPEEFHEAIVYAALERAWRSLRNSAAAADAANSKLMVIRPLLNTDAEERSAMHMGFAPARSRAQLYRGQI